MTIKIPRPDSQNHYLIDHAGLLITSYRRLLGIELLTESGAPEITAKRLFHAAFAVVSHDTAPEPAFNYANLKALELFEFDWEEFIGMPSRRSAEAIHQGEREILLRNVARQGYSQNYQGIRVSKSGRRFYIKNATVWNLCGPAGDYLGQAACFADWQYLD